MTDGVGMRMKRRRFVSSILGSVAIPKAVEMAPTMADFMPQTRAVLDSIPSYHSIEELHAVMRLDGMRKHGLVE